MTEIGNLLQIKSTIMNEEHRFIPPQTQTLPTPGVIFKWPVFYETILKETISFERFYLK